jgi:hypothetical protein
MDGSCGSVSLDAYWNSVAVPFLFIILGFGLFVLFKMNDMQFTTAQGVASAASAIAAAQYSSRSASSRPSAEEEFDYKPKSSSNSGKSSTAPSAALSPNLGNFNRGTGKGNLPAAPSAAPSPNVENFSRGTGKA